MTIASGEYVDLTPPVNGDLYRQMCAGTEAYQSQAFTRLQVGFMKRAVTNDTGTQKGSCYFVIEVFRKMKSIVGISRH
jgi:hypothetical protein